ncbi:MAG: amidohydrolase [Firmicutes bacterium]|nr:amidohydrolase [Bacillota bacterium]
MLAEKYFREGDEDFIVALRREIHEYPETGFDLPKTLAAVKRELDAMGVPYTEKFGRSGVVAVINPGFSGHTVGIRADMDALPVEEKVDLPFRSKVPGKMHACGHDAHTAILLGTARALKRAEGELKCRVKLIFQPSEEGEESGACAMVEDGVMDDIDEIIALHTEYSVPTGKIGVFAGPYMAACHPYTIEFHGKSSHATLPQNGRDALAMAVKAYNDIYLMKCRELDPFSQHVLSISSIQAGTAHNVIAQYAKMLISFRFYDMETHDKIDGRIKQICRNAAEELGGSVEFTDRISAYAVINDIGIAEKVRSAAAKVVGSENVIQVPQKLSSEDFSHYLRKKPGVMFRLGIGNEEKGSVEAPHTSKFRVDEDALILGAKTFVQYVLDQG